METEKFYKIKDGVHELAVSRKWYLDDKWEMWFGTKSTPPYYIRFSKSQFQKGKVIKKKKLSDLQTLEYFKEIIHSKIPESIGSGIRLYFSDVDGMINCEVLREKETYVIL